MRSWLRTTIEASYPEKRRRRGIESALSGGPGDSGKLPVRRIWDLRRGDDDDNRMSPQKGGLRGMILSAVLEFNVVKAAVVFLILIVAPALLLGIAPSVLATYRRWLVGATTMPNPILGLVLYIALAAVALWSGGRVITFAIDNLEHLHYTL